MSLQVWLPLNGSLENKGLSPAKFNLVTTGGGIAASSNGKITPSCYARTTKNTVSHITSDIDFILDGDITMACWCKLTDFGTNDSANGIITQHGHNTGGLGITMRYISANDYRMSINTGTKGDSFPSAERDRTYMTYYGGTNIYNAWHHLCVTYNAISKQVKMYVDGNLETIQGYGTSVTLNGNNITARPFRLFDWSTDHSTNASYRPPCALNDVRLYDHCLSPREVKLLAQGLAAHYKLDGLNLINMIPSMETAFGASSTEYTKYSLKTLKLTGIVNNPEITKTSNTSATLVNGHTYYARYETYQENAVGGSEFFWPVVGGYSFSKTSTANTWNIVSSVFVRNYTSGTYNYRLDFNNSNNAGNMWFDGAMLIDLTEAFGAGNEPTQYWCDVNIPYFIGAYGKSSTTDCSGYGNYLLQTGSIVNTNASPRYSTAINFNQTGYFKTDNFNLTTQQFTCAFWIKAPSTTTDQHFLFGTHNNWTNNGLSAWRDKNGSSYSVIIRSDAETSHSGFGFSFNANTWEHIVYTYTGTEVIGYRNGVEFNRSTYGNNGNVLLPVLYLGNSLFNNAPTSEIDEASMSDFRIYTTALSAAVVKELYQSSIAFLDNGTLQCSEIVENPTNLKYNQNGIVQATIFNENAQQCLRMYDDNTLQAYQIYEL